MVIDQNHSSDSISTKQEVIRYIEKLAQTFGLNEQNAEVYSALSSIRETLKKQFEDCHPQYNTLEKRVERLEKDVGSLEDKLENLDEYVVEDLDECVDRETVVDLIHKIVSSLIGKKGPKGCKCSSYSSESSEESDLVEIIEEPHRVKVREKKDVPHKQRRKARPKRVKRFVV